MQLAHAVGSGEMQGAQAGHITQWWLLGGGRSPSPRASRRRKRIDRLPRASRRGQAAARKNQKQAPQIWLLHEALGQKVLRASAACAAPAGGASLPFTCSRAMHARACAIAPSAANATTCHAPACAPGGASPSHTCAGSSSAPAASAGVWCAGALVCVVRRWRVLLGTWQHIAAIFMWPFPSIDWATHP